LGGRLSADKRKKQIIAKATKLFSSLGYDRTTMKMLAGACRITEPALYRYFPSKEGLYSAVLESLRDKVKTSSLAKKVDDCDDIEKILFLVAGEIFKTYLEQKELARLLLYSSLERHSLSCKVFAMVRVPFVNIVASALERLGKKGKIRKVNPIMTARCFVGMVMDCTMGLSLWNRMQGKSFEPDQVMSNNIPIFARGLSKNQD
jgi:AcrR family transcriptional regulator